MTAASGVTHVHRGRSAPRSRNGCWTCRGKAAKKRCDEQRPVCGRCQRGGLVCDYTPRPKARTTSRTRQRAASTSPGASPSVSASPTSSAPDFFDLPLIATSNSSLALTSSDHEALRYFRTTFAQYHHTKHPQYGCISIMFGLARDSAMVMHMALALGFHEMDVRRQRRKGAAAPLRLEAIEAASSSNTTTAVNDSRPTQHYAAALHMLASVVGNSTSPSLTMGTPETNLEACLSTLWLMLLYEQQFGDPHGRGMAHHLRGAALLAQHKVVATSAPLSLYTVRMLIWIAHIDAAAAAVGLGGFFDRALISDLLAATQRVGETDEGGANVAQTEIETAAAAVPDFVGDDDNTVDLLVRMHRYSNPLYRVTWASAYPQVELLDDLANRSVFHLFTCCGPLRRMIANLSSLDPSGDDFDRERETIGRAITKVRSAFGEVLDVARALSIDSNGDGNAGQPRGLVANLRIVVPTFYAVEIEYARVAGNITTKVATALGEILRLAFQAHRQGGDAALTRIAWPLFVVALETTDLLHRKWVLERFAGMSVLGDHLQRAHRLLSDAVSLQERTGQRADVKAMMPSYGAIVLT
ncbi:hypothetical protein Sste5346_002296 [Sporothrix stenoceras]|uniref:Zn(2)-C6 fungal-type domain-containing protein n=1 Tax=Sporothrix stenoceras TaxID=5173 RepID=A0ABR3ZIQ3_9PEZI